MTTAEGVRLPNRLAFGIAVFAVVSVAILPFALAASNLGVTEALNGFYAHSFVLFAVLGAVIVWRRPGNRIGWLLVVVGAFNAIFTVSGEYVLFGLSDRPGFPSDELVYAVSGWTWVPATAGVVMALPLLFPDGRLLSPRWRPLAVIATFATVLLSVVDALTSYSVVSDAVGWIAYLLFGAAMLACLVPLILRFHRSSGVERQQFKWVLIGLAVSVPPTAVGAVWSVGGGGGAMTLIPLIVSPATITIAVLRYRLYDIDVVINKAVVFAALAGFITAVYTGVVVGLGRLLPVGQDNLGLAIMATALVAVAFEPVRVRVQHWANRMVYGRRATPYETLAAMTGKIGDAADPGSALSEAAQLLAEGTGAAQAVVWVAERGELVPRATAGDATADPKPMTLSGREPPEPDGAFIHPVHHEGNLVGALSLSKRPGEGLSSADRRLVQELAGQAALLLANTRLRSRLSDRLEELRTSRRRMLAAHDRARHALERDLHDGAQQELVAVKVKLGLARTIATKEGAEAVAVRLEDAAVVADQAVDTLRDVARGIYPPLLESEGLASALSAQARRAVAAVTVLDRTSTRYSREVEATAYFCVREALKNAAEHSGAEHAHVELDGDETHLSVVVSDNGVGFDPDTTPPGDGLTHMIDRADAAGGVLGIDSRPGHGTTITLTLPEHAVLASVVDGGDTGRGHPMTATPEGVST